MKRMCVPTAAAVAAIGLLAAPPTAAKDYRQDFDGYRRPTELTLQFGPMLQDVRSDGIRVVWGTYGPGRCEVHYGRADSGKLSGRAIARPQDVTAPKDHWTRAFYRDALVHEAVLTALTPQTAYRYRVVTVGKKDKTVRSPVYEFRTAPDPAGPARPFSFLVYGDTREKKRVTYHYEVVAAIRKAGHTPAFALISGDNANDSEMFRGWLYEFLVPGRELYARVPPYLAVGNHDTHPIDAAKKSRIVTPGIQRALFTPPHGQKDYYSFRYGNVKVICIDTHLALPVAGSGQRKWLRRELVRPKGVNWLIVFGHHPPISSMRRKGPATEASASLMPLYEKAGVDVVFSGHNHHYERLEKDGLVYVTSGGGGAQLYRIGDVLPESRAFKKAHHYCLVEVTAKKLSVSARGIDGKVFDKFVVEKRSP